MMPPCHLRGLPAPYDAAGGARSDRYSGFCGEPPAAREYYPALPLSFGAKTLDVWFRLASGCDRSNSARTELPVWFGRHFAHRGNRLLVLLSACLEMGDQFS
jgi:hypothetical protein